MTCQAYCDFVLIESNPSSGVCQNKTVGRPNNLTFVGSES